MDEAIERMGDKELYLEISRFFASSLPSLSRELSEAVHSASLQEATRFAHSLKSNCAAVGADALRAIAYELEIACRNAEQERAVMLMNDLEPRLAALSELLLSLS